MLRYAKSLTYKTTMVRMAWPRQRRWRLCSPTSTDRRRLFVPAKRGARQFIRARAPRTTSAFLALAREHNQAINYHLPWFVPSANNELYRRRFPLYDVRSVIERWPAADLAWRGVYTSGGLRSWLLKTQWRETALEWTFPEFSDVRCTNYLKCCKIIWLLTGAVRNRQALLSVFPSWWSLT